MPHIHTLPGQHDHTVSAYIIRTDTPEPQLLLHRHKKYKKIMQPGGHIELHETSWQSVQHEIREETGYSISQLQVLQPPANYSRLTAPNTTLLPMPLLHTSHVVHDGTIIDHYHDDTVYVFVTDQLPAARPGEGEPDEIVWLSRVQIEAWDEKDLGLAVKQIAQYVFDACLPTWQPISPDEFST